MQHVSLLTSDPEFAKFSSGELFLAMKILNFPLFRLFQNLVEQRIKISSVELIRKAFEPQKKVMIAKETIRKLALD